MEPWFVLVVNGTTNRNYESDNLTEVETWRDQLQAEGHSVEIKTEMY